MYLRSNDGLLGARGQLYMLFTFVANKSVPPSVIHGQAALTLPGNLLEMLNLGPASDLLN